MRIFVAKKLPNWYCDGEAEGYALLVDGKKFGVVDRWISDGPDGPFGIRIRVGTFTIGRPYPVDKLSDALKIAKEKFNSLPKNVVDKFISDTNLWTPEQEQP